MPRLVPVATLCLLVVATGMVGGAPPASLFDVGQQFDRAQFRMAVYENGSAEWTFHYERTLTNDSEIESFESFANSFNANETPLFRDFRNQSSTLAERGEDATGRPMNATGYNRRAYVTTQLNDVGVVEMAFTWTGFARLEGERVVVGDVFEGGLYVGPSQALVVRAGPGLVFRSVEPTGTLSEGTLAGSDTVTWQGERTFADNHPRVVLAPPRADGATPTGSAQTVVPGTATDTGPDGRTTTAVADGSTPVWPVALVLVVIIGALAAFAYRRRRSPTPGAGSTEDVPTVDETDLLEDEERIVGILEEHGGRMRQSALVEETDWSKSKVSMVLSEMAGEDAIRKLRVGRENIISLPGHEPDAARSSLGTDDDEGPE